MQLALSVVNAFAEGPFTGNPAAVVITRDPLDDGLMQAIAAQNNLAETAFVVTGKTPMTLRWFTPTTEVDLCGHATLASAQVLFSQQPQLERVEFDSASGMLSVERCGKRLQLDFPARPARPVTAPDTRAIAAALGCAEDDIVAVAAAKVLLVELRGEDCVARLAPDFRALKTLHSFAVMVTAEGEQVDFVARFFAPNAGIDEDPVTGSAYTTLAPYWRSRLGRNPLTARQLSARGGWLECECRGERVLICGHAEAYLEGSIHLQP